MREGGHADRRTGSKTQCGSSSTKEVVVTGKIKKLVRDRGFGFIASTDGTEVFFHRTSIADGNFDALNEDQSVEFDVEKSDKGPRAVNVKVVA